MYLNFCHLFQTVLKPLHFSQRYCRDWAYHVSQVRISQAFYNLCGTWWSCRLTWTAHSTAQIKSLTTITTLNKTQLNHKLSLAQFCWQSHRNACLHDETHYLPSFFGNSGAGCFLAFLPGPFGVASVDDLFLPMLNCKETTLHKYIFGKRCKWKLQNFCTCDWKGLPKGSGAESESSEQPVNLVCGGCGLACAKTASSRRKAGSLFWASLSVV